MRRPIPQSQITKRPQSAPSNRINNYSQLRVPNEEMLNEVKGDIFTVFKPENKPLKIIQDITSSYNQKDAEKIKRLCRKFNILKKSKDKIIFEPTNIDIITKAYLRNKNRQKIKMEQSMVLRQNVSSITHRYAKQKLPQEFFKLNHQNIINLEKNYYQKNASKLHPYMNIYEISQIQALTELNEANNLKIKEFQIQAQYFQPEQWQQEHKKVKQIYKGVRVLRKKSLGASIVKAKSLFITQS